MFNLYSYLTGGGADASNGATTSPPARRSLSGDSSGDEWVMLGSEGEVQTPAPKTNNSNSNNSNHVHSNRDNKDDTSSNDETKESCVEDKPMWMDLAFPSRRVGGVGSGESHAFKYNAPARAAAPAQWSDLLGGGAGKGMAANQLARAQTRNLLNRAPTKRRGSSKAEAVVDEDDKQKADADAGGEDKEAAADALQIDNDGQQGAAAAAAAAAARPKSQKYSTSYMVDTSEDTHADTLTATSDTEEPYLLPGDDAVDSRGRPIRLRAPRPPTRHELDRWAAEDNSRRNKRLHRREVPSTRGLMLTAMPYGWTRKKKERVVVPKRLKGKRGLPDRQSKVPGKLGNTRRGRRGKAPKAL